MPLDRRGWPGLSQVFRLPTTGRRVRQEVDDELRFHLEERIEELLDESQRLTRELQSAAAGGRTVHQFLRAGLTGEQTNQKNKV